MRFIRKFYSSMPLIILGGFIIKLNFHGGDDDCGGFPETILTFLLTVIFVVFFVAVLLLALFRYSKTKAKFNYLPLITTAILAILFTIAINWNSIFAYKTILYAENNFPQHHFNSVRIALKDKGKFEVTVNEIEYRCIYKGNYILNQDTLLFERNVSGITDGKVSNKYIIDRSKRLLYPIKSGKITSDSLQYFRISEEPPG